MILSVSRRTDIPALYHDWFFNRLKAGFLYTKNPFNPKQVRKVSLKKNDVTAFVFWTRDPSFIKDNLALLEGYTYYFQITLTPYAAPIEPAFKDKERLLKSITDLAQNTSKDHIVWRYDPVLLNEHHTEKSHYETFEHYASRLKGATEKVIISFVNTYRKNKRALRSSGVTPTDRATKMRMARNLSEIARRYGMRLFLCSEAIDLKEEGIPPAKCIDNERIASLSGRPLPYKKEKYQRENCTCAASIDIGMYDTCTKGCLYCYATESLEKAVVNHRTHDPRGALLFGTVDADATIRDVSLKKQVRPSLFDG